MSATVCVIIPAHNAAATIGDSVRSALAQPELAELLVVDDASTDDTSECARAAAGGDARLTVLRQNSNIGPAAARNLAIAASRAPILAILDADDYLLPGRFAALLAQSDWDMIADNIVFVPESRADLIAPDELPSASDGPLSGLGLAEFAIGNLPRRGVSRGELGFLKPLISRTFIEKYALGYDPALRLGEDFDLYVRMLAAGARFKVSARVGYAARVRANSLSGQHRTHDLGGFLAAARAHLALPGLEPQARSALETHARSLRNRYLLSAFLERKRADGFGAAIQFALAPPQNFMPIARGVLRDKIRVVIKPKVVERRYLLPVG
ncbi:glycosyl transferase family A [Thioclava dalianensis]|uniref:Glycosyl transferase family A n=1 Tax=Thioclava dalianensis TaxID=1185766 RepID=A0A074TI48_9RHOB|nr:glycosyltransferase family 2 protein [Thioclava dalianensis]KEP71391.1 glycosyl transferase family A [Thioclava dalianensis]SFM78923.1 succinoglycan biosynthesis protein ExoU [Thioclava dalianensis]